MYCVSSRSRPAIYSPCSIQCWRRRPNFAKQVTARCGCARETFFATPPFTVHYQKISRSNGGPGRRYAWIRIFPRQEPFVWARRSTCRICWQTRLIAPATRWPLARLISPVFAHWSPCRCVRKASSSVPSLFIVVKFGLLPTSRSRWCRTSPPRPSSPSRIRGCSTNCGSVPTISRIAAAANRDRRRAQGHQPLDLRSTDRA